MNANPNQVAPLLGEQARAYVSVPAGYAAAERTRRQLLDVIDQQGAAIEQQQDRIDLLERLLAPPGKRAMARLQPSPWWVRLARRCGWAG